MVVGAVCEELGMRSWCGIALLLVDQWTVERCEAIQYLYIDYYDSFNALE